MRRLLVALLAAASLATAGSSEAPELEDPAGDTATPAGGAYGDVVAAWIEDETPETFTTALRLTRLEAATVPFTLHRVGFAHDGVGYFTDAFFRTADDRVCTYGRLPEGGVADNPVPDQEPAGCEVAFGAPAEVRVAFAKAYLERPDGRLEAFAAATFDASAYAEAQGAPLGPTDVAEGAGVYVLASAAPPEAPAARNATEDANATPASEDPSGSGASPPVEADPSAGEEATPFATPLAAAGVAALTAAARRRSR